MSTSPQPSNDTDEVRRKIFEHLNPRQLLLAALLAGGFPASSIRDKIILMRSDSGDATTENLELLRMISGLGVNLLCVDFAQPGGELDKTKRIISCWPVEYGPVQADFIAEISWQACDEAQRINAMALIVGRSSSRSA